MHYSVKPSSVELRGLVHSIWCYESDPTDDFERIQPGVGSQLLVNLHENELRHWSDPHTLIRTSGPVGAQGVLTSPVLIDTQQKRNVCGVAFSCFGLSAFCQQSATLFTDSIVDATKLWGNDATDLRNNLMRRSNPLSHCQNIEQFLMRRLIVRSDEDNLIEKIAALIRSGVTLTTIRRKAGLSQRALHSLFDKRIGVRPKTFARVDRFSSTLESILNKEPLTDIALNSGFSDQAHFTREFRTFTGNVPSRHQPVANESHHSRLVVDRAVVDKAAPDKIFKTSEPD